LNRYTSNGHSRLNYIKQVYLDTFYILLDVTPDINPSR
jgi:hypothetical protein